MSGDAITGDGHSGAVRSPIETCAATGHAAEEEEREQRL